MAPSLIRLGAAALAYVSSVSALEAYQLKEQYTPSNFFDKFDFFNQPDPNGGTVKYTSKSAARALGLIQESENEVRIGVNSLAIQPLRESVRLESRNTYNSGLIIADFSHFPSRTCGSWPAFWMVGPNWPTDGEIDIYEGWNLNDRNKVVAHTDSVAKVGSCKIQQGDFLSELGYADCYNYASGQPNNVGCAVDEKNGLFGNPDGGVCE